MLGAGGGLPAGRLQHGRITVGRQLDRWPSISKSVLTFVVATATLAGCGASGGPPTTFTGFGPGTTSSPAPLSGTYTVAFTSNQCNYPMLLVSLAPPTGGVQLPGQLVQRAVGQLSSNQTITLAQGTYDVQAQTPTALCKWVVTLTPK
jgi:hypothetical protein